MPNKQESKCVKLKECPTITKAINNSSHLADRVNEHLDMYRCKKNNQVSIQMFDNTNYCLYVNVIYKSWNII